MKQFCSIFNNNCQINYEIVNEFVCVNIDLNLPVIDIDDMFTLRKVSLVLPQISLWASACRSTVTPLPVGTCYYPTQGVLGLQK